MRNIDIYVVSERGNHWKKWEYKEALNNSVNPNQGGLFGRSIRWGGPKWHISLYHSIQLPNFIQIKWKWSDMTAGIFIILSLVSKVYNYIL